MERDIEKDLIEIDCAIKSQAEKDNIFTMSVLQRCRKLVLELKEYREMSIPGRWIPCSEKMPENEKEVEITYTRKHYRTGETLYFTARAIYEDGSVTTDESAFGWCDTDNWEYDEEADCYIIPEGWFESVSFAEEFGVIDMPVIAWRYPRDPYIPQKGDRR